MLNRCPLISSQAFPVWLALPAIAVAVAGIGLLVSAYKRLTGLGMSPAYFALTRAWSVALLVVILAAFAVVILVDEPLVTAVTAVLVFVATVVLGRRADSVLRDRLRRGTPNR